MQTGRREKRVLPRGIDRLEVTLRLNETGIEWHLRRSFANDRISGKGPNRSIVMKFFPDNVRVLWRFHGFMPSFFPGLLEHIFW